MSQSTTANLLSTVSSEKSFSFPVPRGLSVGFGVVLSTSMFSLIDGVDNPIFPIVAILDGGSIVFDDLKRIASRAASCFACAMA